MINTNNSKSGLANLGQVARGLFSPPEVIVRRIRLERAVGNALDEKFAIAFEEEFRRSANRTRESRSHSGGWISEPAQGSKDLSRRTAACTFKERWFETALCLCCSDAALSAYERMIVAKWIYGDRAPSLQRG